MAFKKITPADRAGKGNVGQPDSPGLTTSEMQELMDSLPNLAIDKFNDHIDELGATTAAGNIGAVVPDNVSANTNVQSVLNSLAYALSVVSENNHYHSNKTTLDEITAQYKLDLDTLLLLMANITSISQTISTSSTNNELPTAKAVSDLLSDKLIHNAVTSFNDRVGAVYPAVGDYTADQVTYDNTTVRNILDKVKDFPIPTSADVDKILYGNMAWGEPPVYNLSELSDVSIGPLQDAQSLVYEAASHKWKNKISKEIVSITKTGTQGLVDTYTITYLDGSTDTFQVTNGKPAYDYAVEGGYVGTEAEFETDLAKMKQYAAQASQAATSATNSATAASTSETNANSSATNAANYATTANTARQSAQDAADDAATAKTAAESAKRDAEDALQTIQDLLSDPHFTIDFSTGNLMYDSDMFNFQIDTTTGNLEWEVA